MKTLNGANAKTQALSVAQADPMANVLQMGPKMPVAVTIALAVTLHAGAAAGATAASLFAEIFAWQKSIRDAIVMKLAQSYDVEVEKEPPPPPKEEPKEEPKDEPKPEPVKAPPKDAPPPPPPAAAQAAAVMTAAPDPNEPVDLTGNTIVTGSGSTFAGGVTQAGGTSKVAVYNPAAAATGVGTGTGTAPAPPAPKVDKSRIAGLSGSDRWDDCPFPEEANAEQIDQAFVTIQVKVKADGSPETVTVIQDPGHGFGREARKCAMRKRYQQALDVEGAAIAGSTKPFRVRFER